MVSSGRDYMKKAKLFWCLFMVVSLIMNPASALAAKEVPEIVDIEDEDTSGNITLDLHDADIITVLRIIAYKAGVDIIAGNEVRGSVTVRLVNQPWQVALDTVLKTHGYVYERQGNVIYVGSVDILTVQKKAIKDFYEVQPTITEVFYLKYIDAGDAKKVLEPQLSDQGQIVVLTSKGQKGWNFGTSEQKGKGGLDKRVRRIEAQKQEEEIRSRTLVVTDIPSYVDKIAKTIKRIDVKPRQIMIEARFVEVDHDDLTDLGFDFATGWDGAESTTLSWTDVRAPGTKQAAGQMLGSQVTPATWAPLASGMSGVFPYNAGMTMAYRKLTGNEFEVIIHALEEKVHTNVLSAPRILALENQEASILIGEKYPILESDVTGTDNTTITSTLDYYQDIGIQLNVVAQVNDEGNVSMIVHPVVSSSTQSLIVENDAGRKIAEYPIIKAREAETQVIMEDGETIVIGGLLTETIRDGKTSVPILGDIPFLGKLFQRNTDTRAKIDLLIFITASIVDKQVLTEKEQAALAESKKEDD